MSFLCVYWQIQGCFDKILDIKGSLWRCICSHNVLYPWHLIHRYYLTGQRCEGPHKSHSKTQRLMPVRWTPCSPCGPCYSAKLCYKRKCIYLASLKYVGVSLFHFFRGQKPSEQSFVMNFTFCSTKMHIQHIATNSFMSIHFTISESQRFPCHTVKFLQWKLIIARRTEHLSSVNTQHLFCLFISVQRELCAVHLHQTAKQQAAIYLNLT